MYQDSYLITSSYIVITSDNIQIISRYSSLYNEILLSGGGKDEFFGVLNLTCIVGSLDIFLCRWTTWQAIRNYSAISGENNLECIRRNSSRYFDHVTNNMAASLNSKVDTNQV